MEGMNAYHLLMLANKEKQQEGQLHHLNKSIMQLATGGTVKCI